jgi:hypothetical protein
MCQSERYSRSQQAGLADKSDIRDCLSSSRMAGYRVKDKHRYYRVYGWTWLRIIQRGVEERLENGPDLEVVADVRNIIEAELGELDLDAPLLPAVMEILTHPWWSRVWVRQELAVARRADFMCGAATLH